MTKKKTNKKAALLVLLALMLVVASVAGTVAWLTAADTETNTFVIGAVSEPDNGPNTPVEPNVPNVPKDPNEYDEDTDGYIFEPYWQDKPVIQPGADIAKDPYVGIGEGSVESYVFVKVENNIGSKLTFTLNEGWAPACGTAEAADGVYSEGIFVYADESGYKTLNAEEGDAWTATPVFSHVSIANDASYEDLAGEKYNESDENVEKTVVLAAFIHQAFDGNGDPINAVVAETAATTHFNPSSGV